MQIDTISAADMPGMAELGISPHSIEDILRDILWDSGTYYGSTD
jgi:hypothetical protein